MTFKTERARIAANPAGPFMNPDHFSEVVTYQAAAGGPARSVRAHCKRTKHPNEEAEVVETDQEELWIKVPRIRSTEQAEGYDAIDAPALGDTIRRPGDPAGQLWSYQGEIRDETEHSFYLLFARNRPTAYR